MSQIHGAMDVPYVSLTIGDKSFVMRTYPVGGNRWESRPQFLDSFSYQKITTSDFNKATATLVNPADLSLEDTLIECIREQAGSGYTKNLVRFQYGWASGPRSKVYEGMLMSYTPEMVPGGYVKLTLDIMTRASKAMGKPMNASWSVERDEKGNPVGPKVSDIVRQVIEFVARECEGCKWVEGYIEETGPIPHDVSSGNLTPVEFIRQKLIPLARSVNGDGGFEFYFDDEATADGSLKVYFKRMFTDESTLPNHVYTFDVYSSRNSRVISFSPEIRGANAALWGIIKAESVNKERFEAQKSEVSSAPQGVNIGSSTTRSTESIMALRISSVTDMSLETKVKHVWEKLDIPMPATLVIVGQPDINPLQSVLVLPVLADGRIHYTGGLYMVKSVTENISGGTYQTELSLVKNATGIGIGVEKLGIRVREILQTSGSAEYE